MWGDTTYSKLDSWTVNMDMELKDMVTGVKNWDNSFYSNNDSTILNNDNYLSRIEIPDNNFNKINKNINHTYPKINNYYLNDSKNLQESNYGYALFDEPIPYFDEKLQSSSINNYIKQEPFSVSHIKKKIHDPFPISNICDDNMIFDLELDVPFMSHVDSTTKSLLSSALPLDQDNDMLQILDDIAELHPELAHYSAELTEFPLSLDIVNGFSSHIMPNKNSSNHSSSLDAQPLFKKELNIRAEHDYAMCFDNILKPNNEYIKSRIRHDSSLSYSTDNGHIDSPSEVSSCVSPNFISDFQNNFLLNSSQLTLDNYINTPLTSSANYSLPNKYIDSADNSSFSDCANSLPLIGCNSKLTLNFNLPQCHQISDLMPHSSSLNGLIDPKFKKKHQNKLAAARYRLKKKEEYKHYEGLEKKLLEENRCFKNKFTCLTHEVNMLKQLLK